MLRKVADITEQRGRDYGPPKQHFTRTANAINAIFGLDITHEMWGQMMIIDKLARNQQIEKDDNLLDIAGYAACVFEIGGGMVDCTTEHYEKARAWESEQLRQQFGGGEE